jgi:hypothetical protein
MDDSERGNFEAYYSFMDFVEATGLKAPVIGKAYNDFRTFTLSYIKSHGFGAITEAYEAWCRQTNYIN